MKNIVLKILLLAFVSCNSELDVIVQDTFDFKVTTEKKEISFINEEVNTSITIEPEQVVKGTKYYFSYDVSKGKGYYKLGDKKLNANDEYELNTLNTELTFITEEITDNEVLITVKNDNDLIKGKTLIYKAVDLNNFKVEVVTSASEIYFKEDLIIDFQIEKVASELNQDLNYELKYVESSLTGDLFVDGSVLEKGSVITDLSEGSIKAKFFPKETGEFELKFKVKASNGKENEVVVRFKVKKTDFEFNVYFSKKENYVNDLTSVNFEILANGIEQLTFELSFTGQEGELKKVGESYSNGEVYNNFGGVFTMDYRAFQIGVAEIEFQVKASNGLIIKKSLSYKSLPTNFEVTMGASDISKYYKFNLFSTFNIIPPDVKHQFLNYKFYYETSGLGATRLTEDNTNTSVAPGELLDMGNLKSGRFTISQQGAVKPQKGELKFTFIDSNGIEVVKKINVNWYN